MKFFRDMKERKYGVLQRDGLAEGKNACRYVYKFKFFWAKAFIVGFGFVSYKYQTELQAASNVTHVDKRSCIT